MKDILKCIDNYPDFPNKGIIFKDIFGVLQEPNLFKSLIEKMASTERMQNSDAILAIEARGFIFGSAISLHSGKPMVVARKPNKLPGKLLVKKYKLEYGYSALSIQKKSIENFRKFIVVDDVLATGGTAKCVTDILNLEGKEILGYSMVLELGYLNGRERLEKPVDSQIFIKEKNI